MDHGELSGELRDVCLQPVLFNHEVRAVENVVTRKITRGLARVNAGLDDCLYMGNLDSLRDWGHARDYDHAVADAAAEAAWRSFVATGRRSVRRFIELTAQELGWPNTVA